MTEREYRGRDNRPLVQSGCFDGIPALPERSEEDSNDTSYGF
jgi:hypothetical protein